MLASTGLTTVNAASAAADAYACPAGYFCGWSGESATGQMYKTNKSVADLGAWDNRIRSCPSATTSSIKFVPTERECIQPAYPV
ncbi:hypothetical protein AOB60_05715 [Streptomyces noursei]|uniref:Peptidase inhibitor n=1 Tax=Streptomyces noursei TaxID=1971 RepID=A0A2N8PHD9_STRNR|nr:hypothetical protein AOB60_05715 [Streptomyces noursei]